MRVVLGVLFLLVSGFGFLNAQVTITSSSNPSCAGSPVTLTASVNPSTAAGTISFYEGATLLGGSNITISGGTAVLTITLPAGSHSIVAQYNGSDPVSPGSSSPFTQVVNSYPAFVPGAHNTSPVTGCVGYNPDDLVFNSPAISGGQTPYNYQWEVSVNGGAWTNTGVTTANYDPPAPGAVGTYSYRAIVTDGCGSTFTSSPKIGNYCG